MAQFIESEVPQPFSSSTLVNSFALTQDIRAQNAPDLGLENKTHSLPGHKSPYLAAALSLVIPGLGEYYVGDHIWRGMIFTGLEAGLWLEMTHWNHRGDDSTTAFRAFSDAHFSPCRYSAYLDSILRSDSIPTQTNCSNIASINHAENLLDSLSLSHPNLNDFTHRVPDPASDIQQYYEVISKYYQYLTGWDAAANFYSAAESRANMNYQYQVAQYFLWGIILNHVLSAIDAALLADDHNTRLTLEGALTPKTMPNGTLGYIPTANIQYRF